MDILNKKINFHIHTKYSQDSLLEPSFIVDYLFQNGYEIAIITDHNTIQGALEAKLYAEKKYKEKFIVIVGEEVKSDIGDIIGFPIVSEVKPANYQSVIQQMREQNSLICLPHPYKSHNLDLIHQEEFINQFDFIEIFNSRIDDKFNKQAEILANKFNKYKIVGNDAHVKLDLLNCYNYFRDNFNNLEFKTKQTSIKNVRKSQIISSYKKKDLIKFLKYLFLFLIGK